MTVIHQFLNKQHHRIVMLVVNCILLFPCNDIIKRNLRYDYKKIISAQQQSLLLRYPTSIFIDLGVGLLGIPLFVYCMMIPFHRIRNCTLIFLAFRTSFVTLGLSMATLSAITMERSGPALER